MSVYRLNTWEEFRMQIMVLHPETIFYLAQPHPLRAPPLGLRLTFYHNQDMYVFVDYADGPSLVKTGIPITNHMNRVQAEIREQDIRDFLSHHFQWVELASLPPFMY
ncbi:MAG: hypothetical protein JSV20_05765 [Candidatus Bathyarchaeota archaeon]|nr:MAG: hypothetical protein JSV20_05765 [Candidatus Bathyarchaeota archaeon]